MPFRRESPTIEARKVSLDPIPPPVKDPVGKPVTGLKEVRLLHNLIIGTEDGKSRLLARGEVIDINLVPEHLRTDQLIEAPDAFRQGKVQLTHDLIVCMPNFDGERTTYREQLFAAHSLIDLSTLPNRIVEGMREGDDYLSSWDEAERRVKETERHEAEETFPMEPDIPPDVSDGKDVHNPYNYSL